MAEPQLYVCKNPGCELGTTEQLGRFTGGMTQTAFFLRTAMPEAQQEEGVHYGEGLCPNCVKDGKGVPGEKWSAKKDLDGKIEAAEKQHKERLATIRKGGG